MRTLVILCALLYVVTAHPQDYALNENAGRSQKLKLV